MAAPSVLRVLLALALLAGACPAGAETRYVNDVLVINLRETPGAGGATVAHLRTGDGFEVLGTQGTYLRVRTTEGQEGWVPQQYTTAETPKARVIAGLRRELSAAKKQAAAAADARAGLQVELETTRKELGATEKTSGKELAAARREARESASRYQQVKKKYDALLAKSKRVLEITAERDALQEKRAELEGRVQELDGELSGITRSNLITGLLVGGGLVLAGWLLGSTSRKKKSRYSVG